MGSTFESRPRRFVQEGVFLILPLMKLTFVPYVTGSIVMKVLPLQLSYLNTYHDRPTGVLSLSDIVYFLARSVSLSLFIYKSIHSDGIENGVSLNETRRPHFYS